MTTCKGGMRRRLRGRGQSGRSLGEHRNHHAVTPSFRPIRSASRVKGKLPGNVDIIVRLFANNDSGYLYDLFMELFEQCQSTTINLRIFGIDKVGAGQARELGLCSWIFSMFQSMLSISSMPWDLDSVTSRLESRGRSSCEFSPLLLLL